MEIDWILPRRFFSSKKSGRAKILTELKTALTLHHYFKLFQFQNLRINLTLRILKQWKLENLLISSPSHENNMLKISHHDTFHFLRYEYVIYTLLLSAMLFFNSASVYHNFFVN